jgi:hypothetical protein
MLFGQAAEAMDAGFNRFAEAPQWRMRQQVE